jgi:hypothetical protein
MLPFLAASGNNNVKSLVLYLAKINRLAKSHPNVYEKFMEGMFAVQRTNNGWSGIFSDLHIEQVLMGSIKSVGGLTQGRGFDENISLTLLMSTPLCAEVYNAIHEVTGHLVSTSECHKGRMKAKMLRDNKDLQVIIDYFTERKPFTNLPELRSLSSGIIADASVNVETARPVGEAIIASMEGVSVADYKFSKKDQVRTLVTRWISHQICYLK